MSRRPTQSGGPIEGGMDTARVPHAASEADRVIREAKRTNAARYLLRSGNADLLPVLGLEVDGG